MDEMLGKCGEWFKLLEESVHVLPQRIGKLFPVTQVREEAASVSAPFLFEESAHARNEEREEEKVIVPG